MLIKGLQKTTLIDYPGKIACTVFLAKCNFRCPFCQNKGLVENYDDLKTIYEEELLDFLHRREKYLEGVVFSGGEPTLYKDLPDLLEKIKKETKLPIKLDTNGSNPEMLRELIEKKLVDYVAMDIKSSQSKYCLAAGVNVDMEKINESVELLKEGKVDYEFRTTVVPDFFTEEDAKEIAEWLRGAGLYALQQFIPSEECIDSDFSKKRPYPASKLGEFRKIMEKSFGKCVIKNV